MNNSIGITQFGCRNKNNREMLNRDYEVVRWLRVELKEVSLFVGWCVMERGGQCMYQYLMQ